jgi:hypothetical protein
VRARSIVLLSLAIWPAAASAGDGVKPRVLPIWPHEPCMIVVDRTAAPVLNLPYSIEQEDPPPGESLQSYEVADSRTHQFFAIARSVDAMSVLPSWVTQADLDAYALVATDHNPMWSADTIDADDVYETSTTWAGLWSRINADDDRRAITFAAAAMGVDWDTTAVALGTYEIHGLTWEPPLNIYARRGGVVKVTDGGDPAQYGPAIALDWIPEGIVLYRNASTLLGGCVDAMPGTTITGEWSRYGPVEWVAFAQDIEVTGDRFELELVAPEELAGDFGIVRVTATDPDDRSYTYYMEGDLAVLSVDDPSACGDTGGFIGEPGCADGSGDSGSAGSTGVGEGSTSTALDETEQERERGCGCAGGRAPAPVAAACVLLALAGRRRRVTAGSRRRT